MKAFEVRVSGPKFMFVVVRPSITDAARDAELLAAKHKYGSVLSVRVVGNVQND